MPTEELISTQIFCSSHNIELSFILLLQEAGLIEITIIEDNSFVHPDQLEQLERLVRLYFEMGINVEGIETISHLLERISTMHREMAVLKSRLQLYEED